MKPHAHRFGLLSVREKELVQRDRMREPAVVCPHCETQTTVADLLTHVEERCPGARAPHQLSRWVTWTEAKRLGVPEPTLSRWINRGLVRSRPAGEQRKYLLRDLALRLAQRRGRRGSDGTFTRGRRRRR